MTGISSSQPAALLLQIERAISALRYGSVEITVHDGRVVQIERTEKIRLANDSHASKNAQSR